MPDIWSDISNEEEETLLNKLVWLKDPLDPTKNRHWLVQTKFVRKKLARPGDEVLALESDLPLGTSDGPKGWTFPLQFLFLSNEDWEDFYNMLAEVKTLLVQMQRSQHYCIVVGDPSMDEHLWDHYDDVGDIGEEPVRMATVQFMEVAAP